MGFTICRPSVIHHKSNLSLPKKANGTSMMMKIIILFSIVAIVLASSAPMQDIIEERSGTSCKQNNNPTYPEGKLIDCDKCAGLPMNTRLADYDCYFCCCNDTTDTSSLVYLQTCAIAKPVAATPAEPIIGK